MPQSRTKFPKQGEFVIAKVGDIQNQYVYVDLIDYDGLDSEPCAKGMIHISEISSRWIKNIRNFVRIGQRIVLRVIRVDEIKGHIDLSLRKVNSAQREYRMKEWKYALKLENLLQFLIEAFPDMTLEQAYTKLAFPILDFFDSYQEAIEELKEDGENILKEIKGVPEERKKKFLDIVNENVSISTVNISGKIKIIVYNGNGIELIKNTLIRAKNIIEKPKETRNIKISYIGAPYYHLDIIAKDYLDAENVKDEALKIIQEEIVKNDGIFEFIQE